MAHTKKWILNIKNSHAAGIDVGISFHAAKVGQDPKHNVSVFEAHAQPGQAKTKKGVTFKACSMFWLTQVVRQNF